jgi:hypothetical protein
LRRWGGWREEEERNGKNRLDEKRNEEMGGDEGILEGRGEERMGG